VRPLGLAIVLFVASHARADCPDAARITTLARRSVAEADDVHVEVVDEGDRWVLVADGAPLAFDDAEHRCDERARLGAQALIAAIEAQLPPKPTLSELIAGNYVPEAPPSAQLAATREWTATLDIGAALDVARGGLFAGGGFARAGVTALLGNLVLGGALGVVGQSPGSAAAGQGSFRIERVPVDLDARVAARLGRLVLGADFGVSVAALHIAADASVPRAAATRIELGLRLAARLEVPLTSRLGFVLGIDATVVPSPDSLPAPPRADVVRLPDVWVVASLGVVIALR
jgi:hypothetical protein